MARPLNSKEGMHLHIYGLDAGVHRTFKLLAAIRGKGVQEFAHQIITEYIQKYLDNKQNQAVMAFIQNEQNAGQVEQNGEDR